MFRLCTASTLPIAHLFRGLLANEGIDARVLNENAQSLVGEIPVTHAYPEVWLVRHEDESRARAILRAAERSVPGESYCRTCNEANPKNFEVCWHCGAEI